MPKNSPLTSASPSGRSSAPLTRTLWIVGTATVANMNSRTTASIANENHFWRTQLRDSTW